MKGLSCPLVRDKAPSFLGQTFLTHTRVPSAPAHQSIPVTSRDVWSFDSLTFSLRLRALMTFAAKVRPEEFSTHLCTWPKRPLIDEGGRGNYTLHPGNMLEKRGPGDLCFNDRSESDLRFSWDVLPCRVCLICYSIKSELGCVSSLKTWINT